MHRFQLSDTEVTQIEALLSEVAESHTSVEDRDFQECVSVYAQELPRRLRLALNEFRLAEREPVLVIAGYPVDDDKIGNTPSHWQHRSTPSPAFEEEIYLLLLGSLLGDAIAWGTQQAGRLVHDILPIQGHEHEQLGSSSDELLWWHTEDAFHPARGDYLGMMCMRNPDEVPTQVGALSPEMLQEDEIELLFAAHYSIRPDESHLIKNRPAGVELAGTLAAAYERMEEMNTAAEKIPLLYGHRHAPYLRIDPYFMPPADSEPAQKALCSLTAALERSLVDVLLHPGDVCFIDNYKAVHGRKPFRAHFDGKDRWLKRINVARDLRKSRASRDRAESRVIV